MLEYLAELGQSSVAALWLPVALWTTLALVTEAALRLGRAEPALALPVRGATLAALPVAVLLPVAFRTLAPEAAVAVAAVAPVPVAFLPEIVVGEAAAVPVASGPSGLDVLLGLGLAAVVLSAVVGVLRLVGSAAMAVRAVRRLPAAPEAVQARLDAACARLGVRHSVRAVTSAEGTPPFTFGWRRPVVAVPSTLAGEPLDLALLHEAAHVRRADAAWLAAQRAVAALSCAHPLVHVLGRGLNLDRERDADATVLAAAPGRRRAYADLLFSFASTPPPALALGATPGSSTLKTRLDAMTQLSSPLRRAWMARFGRLGGALLLLLAGSLTLAATAQPPPPPAPAAPLPPDAPPAPPAPPPVPDHAEAIQQVNVRSSDGEDRVEIRLKPGYGRETATDIADQFGDDTEADGRVIVRYQGGVVERQGLKRAMLPSSPPAPPQAPDAPAPPPPPPPSPVGVAPERPALDRVRADRDTTDEVFEVVEVMPQLIGGLSGIQDRIEYPELQRRAGVEGRAVLQFIVNKTGEVEDIQVIRSSGNDGLDRAAIEAVRPSRFEPGMQGGAPVRVRFAVPVTFRLPAAEDEGDGRP